MMICIVQHILFSIFSIFPGEEVRAEFFMQELNNGVKLCQLIGALQTKIAESCPSALCKVSQTAAMKIAAGTVVQKGSFHAHTQERALQVSAWTNL